MKSIFIVSILSLSFTGCASFNQPSDGYRKPSQASNEYEGIRKRVFIQNGTFTVPDNVTTIYISAVGGGGGGGALPDVSGSAPTAGGGGGSGAAIFFKPFTVEPGAGISIVVGEAGKGGMSVYKLNDPKSDGTAGTATIIGNLITLNGGQGGKSGGPVNGLFKINTGAGGASGGTGGTSGTSGGTTEGLLNIAQGGFGGSNYFGQGAFSASCNLHGSINKNFPQPAAGFGSGGAGGYHTCDNDRILSGSDGAKGFVMIEW